MAVPAITAQIINLLYNIVDRMYIGHIPVIGATALTGVGVTFPVITLITAFSSLIGMGGAARAAIFMGRRDNLTAEEILGNCCAALLCISVVLTAVILLFCEPLLMAFGASTIGYAAGYLRIYAAGTIFVQTVMGLNMFITSQGFARVGMKTTIIGAACNIVLDPIFIFVLDLGVQGAAWATILSQAVSAVWVLAFLTGQKTTLHIRRAHLRLNPKIIGPVLALGISPFIMQSTESLLSICFNTQLQRFGGDSAVGAMAILTSVMQFGMLPLMGLTQGAQPIISYNFGARNADRVKKAFHLLLTCCMVFTCVLWAGCMLVPQAFILIFSSDAALVGTSVWAMRVYMGTFLFFGAQIACQQTFIALGQAAVSLFLALLRKVILLIPLIFILPLFFQDKVFAVFLAEPVADFLAVSVTVLMFTFRFRKILADLQNDPPGPRPGATA
ncbi:MAG: MATE family efflux transporter [Oscillospiraceae bacterium]|nr:MATE family efflux transporter [Oscillospiraceae bacterium]